MKKRLEKDIQRDICEWLEQKGFMFWRSNNIPVFGKNNGGKMVFRAQSRFTPKGLPDICLVVLGKFIGIEVKCTTKQSEEQKHFQDRLELAGGIYLLAYSLEDVTLFFEDLSYGKL